MEWIPLTFFPSAIRSFLFTHMEKRKKILRNMFSPVMFMSDEHGAFHYSPPVYYKDLTTYPEQEELDALKKCIDDMLAVPKDVREISNKLFLERLRNNE